MSPVPSVPAENVILFRLLAIGQGALVVATWPLWIPQTEFPQVPLITLAGRLPPVCDAILLLLILALLLGLMFAVRFGSCRGMSLLLGIATFGSVCLDQHRLQPWVWQFLILSAVLGTADDATARRAWRWLVIGIYAWSAWSKMDRGFLFEHGPFLLDGLCKSVGFSQGTSVWPAAARTTAAALIPSFELLVAIGLAWQRTRTVALIGSIIMHVGLLLALGPLGHNHQPGVLIWNLFFIIQNGFLFRPALSRESSARTREASQEFLALQARAGNRVALAVVAAAMLWPLGETWGWCDHWTAWAVYAARPERVMVFVEESDVERLPDNLQVYLGQAVLDEGVPLRIDRWSLETTRAPLYPQDRFQVGVALWVAHHYQISQLRLIVEGPANRWSGRRTIHRYEGPAQIEQLAQSFRCGTSPR